MFGGVDEFALIQPALPCLQVTVDGSVRLYTLDWDGPFQFAGELLASIPHSKEEDYTAYFWQVNSKDVIVLGKLAQIVRNSVAGQAYKNFIPGYAAIWSWTRNSTSVSLCIADPLATYIIIHIHICTYIYIHLYTSCLCM